MANQYVILHYIEAIEHVLGVIQTRLNQIQQYLANLGLVDIAAGFTSNNVRFDVNAINEWQLIVANDQHVMLSVMQVEGQPFTRIVRFIIQEHPGISYQIYLRKNQDQDDWVAYYQLHPDVIPIRAIGLNPGIWPPVHSVGDWLYMCGRVQGDFGVYFKIHYDHLYEALQPSLEYLRTYILQVTAFIQVTHGWPQMFPQNVVQDYHDCMNRIQTYEEIVFDIPILMNTLVNNAFVIDPNNLQLDAAQPPDWTQPMPPPEHQG